MRETLPSLSPKLEKGEQPRGKDRLARMTALLGLAVLVGCAGIILVVGIGWTPMDYDEGYNLQVPEHLAAAGAYATDGSLYEGRTELFDVYISTGPTLLVPIGALFALTGPNLFVARLVPTAGYVLLLVGCWRLGNRYAGRFGGILTIEAVLGINAVADWPLSAILGTGSVLGEYTAAALVMWAALSVHARPRVAGALIGLAALTKLLTVLALPGFVAAVIVARARHGRRPPLDAAAQLVGGCVLPLAVWELFVFASLGPAGYITHLQAFARFFVNGGSGLSGFRSQGVQPRFEALGDALPGPAWLLPGLLVLVVLARAATAVARHAGRGPSPTYATPDAAPGYEPLLALGLTSCGTIIWWLCIAQQAWIRQAMPAVVWGVTVLTVTMAMALHAGDLRLRRPRRWTASLAGLALAMGLLVPVMARVHEVFQLPGPSLASQEQAAGALRATGRQPVNLGWYQNPELMFLAHRVSAPRSDHTGLLVLPDTEKALAPVAYEQGLADCGHKVRHSDGYLFCLVGSPTNTGMK